ncbi:hypothetical protein D5S18_14605 [Nocardia panacis]|uniref:Uncharacterized protein n=1 Tax=Nocardia panacis TaxID=2340916 RepID=A0A3A4K3C3_9NOCA|nr:hypothetical protein [Nocardia panacis]RJO74703.1 hypothetical protein D5S18_14605 [Nocardia panacis]
MPDLAFRARRVLARIVGLVACPLLLFAAAPIAHAAPAYAEYLDLPALNAAGERGGGLNPALPLDESMLASALDQVRADGLPPSRYATLLRQYWLVVAARNAEIDLTAWDPTRGVAANERTFIQVYVNYQRLAMGKREFWWAGMAELAGGSFASAFVDLDEVAAVFDLPGLHRLGVAVADLLRGTPPELVAGLPEEIRRFAAGAPRLTAADIAWYQTRLMVMQRHIFTDLVSMHEAYTERGMSGIDELFAAGAIDESARTAWRSIDSGTREGSIDALTRMADREQNQIIADQWDATAAGRGETGRVLTYASTLLGKSAIPGVRAPGVYAPATVRAEVGGHTLALRTPLPDFDWADRDTRWAYLLAELIPRHIDLESDPAAAAAVLGEPFSSKLIRGRLGSRLPDLLADLGSEWAVVN